MAQEIDSRLTHIFQTVFDDDSLQLRPGMTAAEIENWDSLTHIDLITAVEREFKVKLTTGEVTGLKNVGELVALVEKKTGSRS
jgi:acyl carrier protein